jgi:hypothetical protein
VSGLEEDDEPLVTKGQPGSNGLAKAFLSGIGLEVYVQAFELSG